MRGSFMAMRLPPLLVLMFAALLWPAAAQAAGVQLQFETKVLLGRGRPKIVRYWEMTFAGGGALRPANEVDEARWVTVADAVGLLTYEHDRGMLDRMREQV